MTEITSFCWSMETDAWMENHCDAGLWTKTTNCTSLQWNWDMLMTQQVNLIFNFNKKKLCANIKQKVFEIFKLEWKFFSTLWHIFLVQINVIFNVENFKCGKFFQIQMWKISMWKIFSNPNVENFFHIWHIFLVQISE